MQDASGAEVQVLSQGLQWERWAPLGREKCFHKGTSELSGLGADRRALLTPLGGVLESTFNVGCAVLGTGISKSLAQKGQ